MYVYSCEAMLDLSCTFTVMWLCLISHVRLQLCWIEQCLISHVSLQLCCHETISSDCNIPDKSDLNMYNCI